LRQGLYDSSLALLKSDLPSRYSQSEIAVWQELTLGSDFAYLDRFPEADSALNQAQDLARKFQPALIGEAMLRLGTLNSFKWKLEEAQKCYREALTEARDRKNSFLEASALGSLGLIAIRMEHYDESVDWNRKALESARAIGALSLIAKIEGNIAWGHHKMGDFLNALEVDMNAEKDAQAAGLHQDRVLSLLSVGSIYFDMHKYSAAEADTRKAFALAKEINDTSDEVYGDINLALIALATDRISEAENKINEAAVLENSAPDQSQKLYLNLVEGLIASKTNRLPDAEKFFNQLISDPTAPKSVRWEAQAGLAELFATHGKPAMAEREFKKTVLRITEVWRELREEEFSLSFLSSVIRFYDDYVNFLLSQGRVRDALNVADLSRAQALERGLNSGKTGNQASTSRGDTPADPQNMARRLKATILFYWLGEKSSHLWVIGPEQIFLVPLPGSEEIDVTVQAYRDSFVGPLDPLEAGNPDARKLYALLIQPAEKFIRKNSRVVILADGSLNALNFETLVAPDPKPHYWIDDVTVFCAPSLALLSHATVNDALKPGKILLVGDASAASRDFPVLPQAGKEVGLVGKYFAGSRRQELTGANATASRYLSSRPEEFSILHFATHGTASTMRPLESAVILSPDGDGYKLYARDILQHPLHADLVTISACNGAGMRTYAGEGLVGLSWAFLRAGAHNVIAGLWEVSNSSTPQLMDELYKGLSAGLDPATALRKAKLTLVHSDGNYRKPFYWAPFQLYAGS
jgi:CHAT domain-containing protein